MSGACPVCGQVGSRERGEPCPRCGARGWIREQRFSRTSVLVGGAVLGAALGGAVAVGTGFPLWPVIGAVIGVGLADLAAGAR